MPSSGSRLRPRGLQGDTLFLFPRSCHAAADVMADLSVGSDRRPKRPPAVPRGDVVKRRAPLASRCVKGPTLGDWEWSQLTSLISSASHHLGHTNLRIMINQDVTVPVAFLLYTFRHIPHAGDTNEALNISSQQLEHHTWLERSNNALPDDQRQPGLESESRSHSKRNP